MTDQQPHTPTTADIRNAVTRDESDWREAGAQFDSWLTAHDAQVRREAKAEALLALANTPVAQHRKSKAWLHHAGCTISLDVWLISELHKIRQEDDHE